MDRLILKLAVQGSAKTVTVSHAFRDWLRSHPEDRQAYADLKHKLAEEADENDPLSVVRYTIAKGDFVKAVVRRALEA